MVFNNRNERKNRKNELNTPKLISLQQTHPGETGII